MAGTTRHESSQSEDCLTVVVVQWLVLLRFLRYDTLITTEDITKRTQAFYIQIGKYSSILIQNKETSDISPIDSMRVVIIKLDIPGKQNRLLEMTGGREYFKDLPFSFCFLEFPLTLHWPKAWMITSPFWVFTEATPHQVQCLWWSDIHISFVLSCVYYSPQVHRRASKWIEGSGLKGFITLPMANDTFGWSESSRRWIIQSPLPMETGGKIARVGFGSQRFEA